VADPETNFGMIDPVETVPESDAEIMFGVPRSPKWAAVRADFLADHPRCACCGGSSKLNVHHVEPFHVRPERELDPANLLTLCEGGNGLNCHFWIGHCGNWAAWNILARADAADFGTMLQKRAGIPWKG
jgi:5-methylcytosine-specific restriction enzyme A